MLKEYLERCQSVPHLFLPPESFSEGDDIAMEDGTIWALEALYLTVLGIVKLEVFI